MTNAEAIPQLCIGALEAPAELGSSAHAPAAQSKKQPVGGHDACKANALWV